jgi:hypothetical protein
VSVTDFLAEEYEYLRESEGRDIFLALAPYVKALEGQAEVREVLTTLQAEAQQALQRFAAEQNDLIEEAKAIRRDLAKEATEIDNSDMKEPDRASHAHAAWDFDSFARFDDLVELDKTLQIGYPLMPDDTVAPGIVSRLLRILSGRLRAAEYGEDASSFDPPIRRDLGDLGLRIRTSANATTTHSVDTVKSHALFPDLPTGASPRAAADQELGDLERLLAVVGLRDEQLLDVDADPAGVLWVHRVLGVDEGADPAAALSVGDHVVGERRLNVVVVVPRALIVVSCFDVDVVFELDIALVA